MSAYTSLSALFQAICNSVRKKEGTSSLINHQELPARILALPSGGAGPGTGAQKMPFGIVEAECLYFDGLNEYGNIIPVLTSDSSITVTVKASSQYSSSYAGWKAFDGNEGTFWAHGTGTSTLQSGREMPCHMDMIFPRKISFDGYLIRGAAAGEYPKSWELLGSNDGSSYEVIDSQNEEALLSDREIHSYSLDKVYSFKYVRLRVTDSTNYCGICQFNLTREEK